MSVRDEILSKATQLFASRGFDGTSLQDIAKAVGIKKASLLYHFPSKEELRRSVLFQLLAHWRERVPRLLMAATSGKGQFDSLMQEMVGFFAADPDRARLLLREVLDRPEEMRQLLEAHVRPWVCTVCEHIRGGREAGRVHEDLDPEAYVIHAINLVIGSLATFECVGALLPGSSESEARGRHIGELHRLARRGLFREQGHTEAPSPDGEGRGEK